MPVTLDQLVAVRSQLAQGLRAYLRAVIDRPDQERPAYLGARRMTDLYVSADVLKEERTGERADRRGRRAAGSPAEEEQGRFARDEDENRRTRVAWERERRTLRRAVILGVPGSGKTLLARMTARAVAEASLAALDEQKTGVRELDLPVCVRVADVAREGALAPAISAVVRATTARALTTPPDASPPDDRTGAVDAVVRHIRAMLETERGWLFLDALDEVPDRAPLKAALEPLRHARCRVVVTSRPYGYDRTLLPWPSVAEYELAPFAPRQRRQFVDRWFPADATGRGRVLELVQGAPHFGDLTRNALLLTLTCGTAEGHDFPADARRVDLYRVIVRELVRGAWKDHALAADDPRVSVLVDLLRAVAWDLFCDHPARTAFPDSELLDAVRRASGTASSEWLEQTLRDLRATGLLASPAAGHWMFLHRTVLEYLAAAHVARQQDPLSHIERFLWQRDTEGVLRWQPPAGEMLCFVAGCVKDPNPLLRRLMDLDNRQRDHFRTMLLLAGRALADIPEGRLSGAVAQCFMRQVSLAPDPNEPLRWGAGKPLEVIEAERAVDALMARLPYDPDPRVAVQAAMALSEIETEQPVDAFIERLRDDPDEPVRSVAVTALGAIGSEGAVDPLIEHLRHDPEERVREAAAEALGAIGSEQAVDPLVERLRDDAAEVRAQAAVALGDIGSERALDPLIERLRDDQDHWVRYEAAKALGAIGSEQAVDPLVDRLRDDAAEVRRSAAVALGVIGSERAIGALIEHLRHDPKEDVRWQAARALGAIGSERAVDVAIERIESDRSWIVRAHAMQALREVSRRTGRWIAPVVVRARRLGE